MDTNININQIERQNEQPFNISESALAQIQKLQSQEAPGSVLRLAVYSGGCSGFKYHLSMETQIEHDDTVIEVGGNKVMVLDMATLDMLQGGKIDFVDEVSGSYFKIQNPNAKSSCGCGNSFS